MPLVGEQIIVNGQIGVIRYVGETEFAQGIWYGVELEEETGKNDGSVDGIRYFDLQGNKVGKYGIFSQHDHILTIKEFVAQKVQENVKLRRVIDICQSKLQTLRQDLLVCQQKASNEELDSLRDTVEKLTLRDLEVSTENDMLSEKVKEITEQNKEFQKTIDKLQVDLGNWQSLHKDSDVDGSFDIKVLQTRNNMLQNSLKKLESSMDELLNQYEETLHENTQLIEENNRLVENINTLKSSLDEYSNKIGAENSSNQIVEYLTSLNNDLHTELEKIKAELSESKAIIRSNKKIIMVHEEDRARLNNDLMKANSESVKLAKELEAQLIENKKLKDDIKLLKDKTLLQKDLKIKDLSVQLSILEQKVDHNLKYTAILNQKGKNELKYMILEIEFIKASLFDSRIQNSDVEKYRVYLYLSLVQKIAEYKQWKSYDASNLVKEDIIDKLRVIVDIPEWKQQILKGNIDTDIFDLCLILKFIKIDYDSNSIGLNVYFMSNIVTTMFGEVLPKILPLLKPEHDLDTLSDLYSLAIRIESLSSTVLGIVQDDNARRGLLKTNSYVILECINEMVRNLDSLDTLKKLMMRILSYLQLESNTADEKSSQINVEKDGRHLILNSRRNSSNNKVFDIGDKEEVEVDNSKLVKELEIKIKILQAKFLEKDNFEATNSKLKEILQVKESECRKSEALVLKLQDKLQQTKKELDNEKLNKYHINSNHTLNKTILDHDKVKHIDLVSELISLRKMFQHEKKTKFQESRQIDLSFLSHRSMDKDMKIGHYTLADPKVELLCEHIENYLDICVKTSGYLERDGLHKRDLTFVKERNIFFKLVEQVVT